MPAPERRIERVENQPVLAYLRSGHDRPRALLALPEQVADPYLECGCHPDVVARLWDELGSGLPREARVLVLGTPALVHPRADLLLALGLGTSYALRLPPEVLDQPEAAALEHVHRFSGADQVLDLGAWGPTWRFGAYDRREPGWLARAAAALADG